MPPVIPRGNWIRWLPSLVLMALIYRLSSIPGPEIPFFGAWDFLVKKLGHAVGYGMLGVSYYYGLPPSWPRAVRWPLAWVLALGFALSDEFHQGFVHGRTASLSDVGFDIFGATLALIWGGGYRRYRGSRSAEADRNERSPTPPGGSRAVPPSAVYADPAEASQADPPAGDYSSSSKS